MFDYVYIENVTESRDGGDGRKVECLWYEVL